MAAQNILEGKELIEQARAEHQALYPVTISRKKLTKEHTKIKDKYEILIKAKGFDNISDFMQQARIEGWR